MLVAVTTAVHADIEILVCNSPTCHDIATSTKCLMKYL